MSAYELSVARARLAHAEAQFDAADGRVGLPTADPGAHSGVTRTMTARQRSKSTAASDRALMLYREVEIARKNLARIEARIEGERREQERRTGLKFDVLVPDLRPGDLIYFEKYGRTRAGTVVRVNKTTVTVEAAPGFDKPKVPHAKILGTTRKES